MNLLVDNAVYSNIGPAFTRAIIRNIADAMDTAGLDINKQNPSVEHLNLIENICFNIFVTMEGPNRIKVDETNYFTHLTFSTDRSNPEVAVMADNRAILHGEALTRDLVLAALADI